MALEDFRLCEDQNNSDPFVTVLAGDGKIRVITRVSRDAIDDHWQLSSSSQQQRVRLVQDNLNRISNIIARKYHARDHTRFTDRFGNTDENNRLITVDLADLEGEDNRTT